MREASTKWEDGFFGVVCCVRYACVYLTLPQVLVLVLVDTGGEGQTGGRPVHCKFKLVPPS